uniref:Uncharacterized protein n=1 Tax=Sipha flava TaxID=143950 RepID=A0A2S2R6N3_9HEMI
MRTYVATYIYLYSYSTLDRNWNETRFDHAFCVVLLSIRVKTNYCIALQQLRWYFGFYLFIYSFYIHIFFCFIVLYINMYTLNCKQVIKISLVLLIVTNMKLDTKKKSSVIYTILYTGPD